jgi:hypothetical protein
MKLDKIVTDFMLAMLALAILFLLYLVMTEGVLWPQ